MSVSQVSRTNYGRKISATKKIFDFSYSLTRSVNRNLVVTVSPLVYLGFCVQFFVMNTDYHHPYPTFMKDILWYESVITDPFFFVKSYIDVYLYLVIFGLWAVILFIGYGLYCYFRSGIHDRFFLILSIWSKLFSTVFLIPLVALFYKSTRCNYFDGSMVINEWDGSIHGHRCDEIPYLPVMIVNLIFIVVVTLIALSVSLVNPDRLYSSSSFGASPTGRWKSFWILVTVLIYFTKVFYNSDEFYIRMISPILSIVLNLILFMVMLVKFPYYWKFMNFVVGITICASIGGQISAILVETISQADTSDLFGDIFYPTALATCIGIAVFVGSFFLGLRCFFFLCGVLIFKKSRRTKSGRFFLRLVGPYSFSLYLPYATNQELEKLDKEIGLIYPKSINARVYYILRCFEKKSFDTLRLKAIVRKLMQSQFVQKSISFDIQFYLFNISERVIELDFMTDSSQKNVVKMVSRASKYERMVRRTLKKIWGCYLSEKINIKSLSSLYSELEENEQACNEVYKRVLKKGSDSSLVLRRYGKYLLDIRLQHAKADGYLRQAFQLENLRVRGDSGEMELSSEVDHKFESYSDDGSSLSSFRNPIGRIRRESNMSASSVGSRDGGSPSVSSPGSGRESSVHEERDKPMSMLSAHSNSSLPSTKYNNYLEVDKDTKSRSSNRSIGRSDRSGLSTTSLQQKKRFNTRISRENILSVACLYCCVLFLFVVSISSVAVVFSLARVVDGIVEDSHTDVELIDNLTSDAIHVATAASELSSTTDPDEIDFYRGELANYCSLMSSTTHDLYSGTKYKDLFREFHTFYHIDEHSFPLIDALTSWRKYCEMFLNYENVYLLSNDTATAFLFDNTANLATILREVMHELVGMVDEDIVSVLTISWILQIIPLLTFPLIIPLVLYFCMFQRSLLKSLLLIPKDAVFDTYRKFGGRITDNHESKTFRSQMMFDTITKFCCYIFLSFLMVYGSIILMTSASQLSQIEFVSYLHQEAMSGEYQEKLNIIHFYIVDYQNPYNPYYPKNVTAELIVHEMHELEEVHRSIRFGNEYFAGVDENSELNELFYKSRCDISGIGGFDVETLKCFSFNELIDVHHQAVETLFEPSSSAEDIDISLHILEEIDHNDEVFNDMISEIRSVMDEEFDEFHKPTIILIVGFFVSSIIVITFNFCCIISPFPKKLKRHLHRIRASFLYLSSRHLMESKLYQIMDSPPGIIPWMSFSNLQKTMVKMKEKETRQLLEDLPSYGVVVFNQRKRITFLNDEAKNMMGLPDKKLAYGLKITNFFVDSSKLLAWMKSGESNTFTDELEMNSVLLDFVDEDGDDLTDRKNVNDDDYDEENSTHFQRLRRKLESIISEKKEQQTLQTLGGESSRFGTIITEEPSSNIGKKFNIFHARLSVVRKKKRYLAVMKNIQSEMHQKQLVEHEKKRSEDYLYNILPKKIAKSFLSSQKTERNLFVVHQETTVVFQDMVGFTFYSSHTQPELIIAILNELFKGLDDLCIKNNMEKIKTIGDAYLAACGVPEYVHDHVIKSFTFARECLLFLHQFNFQKERDFQLRSGIHTGKVVAGVIGKYKYQYDIWGDAVNIAARMEQTGIPDKIQVSREVYAYLYKDYEFQERDVFLKGKGNQKAYIHTVENTFMKLEEEEEEDGEDNDDDDDDSDSDNGRKEEEDGLYIGKNQRKSNSSLIAPGTSVDDVLGIEDNNNNKQEEIIDEVEMKKREEQLRRELHLDKKSNQQTITSSGSMNNDNNSPPLKKLKSIKKVKKRKKKRRRKKYEEDNNVDGQEIGDVVDDYDDDDVYMSPSSVSTTMSTLTSLPSTFGGEEEDEEEEYNKFQESDSIRELLEEQVSLRKQLEHKLRSQQQKKMIERKRKKKKRMMMMNNKKKKKMMMMMNINLKSEEEEEKERKRKMMIRRKNKKKRKQHELYLLRKERKEVERLKKQILLEKEEENRKKELFSITQQNKNSVGNKITKISLIPGTPDKDGKRSNIVNSLTEDEESVTNETPSTFGSIRRTFSKLAREEEDDDEKRVVVIGEEEDEEDDEEEEEEEKTDKNEKKEV